MFSSQFRDLERVQSLNPCWSGFADGISAIPRPGALGPPALGCLVLYQKCNVRNVDQKREFFARHRFLQRLCASGYAKIAAGSFRPKKKGYIDKLKRIC